MGAAIHLQKSDMDLINVTISDNNNTSGQGALYAFASSLYFKGNNSVIRNQNTGLILDGSHLHIHGILKLFENIGGNGGALSLYGRSKLHLYNMTHLIFYNNRALYRGGAIYVEIPEVSTIPQTIVELNIHHCFFLFHGDIEPEHWNMFNGEVNFVDNVAYQDGDAIFTTTLRNCRFENTEPVSEVLLGWKNFHFTGGNSTTFIATNAVRICYNYHEWSTLWPGKLLNPHIYLFDELNNTITDSIHIFIRSEIGEPISLESNNQFVVKRNEITLRLVGPRNKPFNITIDVTSSSSIPIDLTNLKLGACYFGFTYVQNIRKCKCDVQSNLAKGIAQCPHHGSHIYLLEGRWADPAKDLTRVCPSGYCKKCHKQVCLFQPDHNQQCIQGRNQSSLLCSKCNNGFSVPIGGETCRNCSNECAMNFLWIIPLIMIGISIIVLIVLRLNIDIYSNYLNSCLYYYQIVSLLFSSSLDLKKPNKIFIDMITWGIPNIGADRCLWNNMNDLEKNAFRYLIPIWMITILYIIFRYGTQSYFNREHCLRAFTIISVFAYSEFTTITFRFFKSVKIGEINYVWIYAAAPWGGKEHFPYLVIAFIIFIVIVIGCPWILMFSSGIVTIQIPFISNPFVRWDPVFNSYKYCFKPGRTWFASYYFVCRTLLLALAAVSEQGPMQNVILAVLCLYICFLFAICSPYERYYMNVFDILVLADLTAVSILSLAMRGLYSDQRKKKYGIAINILTIIPITFVVLRLLGIYVPRLWRSISMSRLWRSML